ncbi:hypothetical protein [Sphingopyxis sp.]|uniref:hypothetical protein n=1 Tax=Sphingopyxis sp. TaxID=1908224 RepID=UPI003BAAC827
MVYAEIRFMNLNDWRGQLRESDTDEKIGEEWQASQRGELIGKMSGMIPLTHLSFHDANSPLFD